MAFTGSWGQWYEEAEHPRGRGGRWVSKGGGELPSSERRALGGVGPSQPKLSKQEREAFRGYVGPDYKINNDALRKDQGAPLDPRFWNPGRIQDIKTMDTVFARTAATKPLIVYRAVTSDFAEKLRQDKGKEFVDYGFVSASTDKQAARNLKGGGYSVMEIRLPVGSPAISMAGISPYAKEQEVLIGRGNRFRISTEGRKLVLELVPSTPQTEGKVYFLPTQRAKEARPPEPPKPRNVFVDKWHEKGIFAPLDEDNPYGVRYAKTWVENRPSDELLAESAEGLATLFDEDGLEHGVLIEAGTKDRTHIWMHPGDKHHVNLDSARVPDGAWDLMHNHPSSSPQSVGDVGWLNSAKSAMSIHVVDSSGGVFAVSLPKRTRNDRGSWTDPAFHDVIDQAHFAMDKDDDGNDIFQEEVSRLTRGSRILGELGEVDEAEYSAMMLFFKAHARNRAYAQAGLINYDYELSDTQKRWMETHKDSFDRYDRIGLKRVRNEMRKHHDLKWQTEEEEFKEKARVFRKIEGVWQRVPAEEEAPLVADKDLEEAGINVEEKELVAQSWKQLHIKAKKFKQLATAGLEGLTTITGVNEHKIAVNSILAGGTEFDFSADTRSKDLNLGLIQMTPGHQGFGEGKKLLGGLAELAEGVGMKQISLRANIDVGGYAWAKYGFTPTELSWAVLKRNLVLDMPDRPTEPKQAKEWDKVQRLAKSDDPHALWPIADSVYGRNLLLNSTWDGVLKFNDTRAMRRFNAYITKKSTGKRTAVKKAPVTPGREVLTESEYDRWMRMRSVGAALLSR